MPKKEIQVLIGGKVYTLSGEDSEEYMQKVALYINNKLSQLRVTDNAKKLNTQMMGILLALNIADDYFKVKEKVTLLENELEEKEKIAINLEQDIVDHQIELNKAEEYINKYKAELNELEKEFEKEIEKKEEIATNLEQDIINHKNRLEEKEKELNKSKEKVILLEKEIDKKEKISTNLERDIINHKFKLEETEKELNKSKEEVLRLEKEVIKYQIELEEFINTFDDK